MDILCKECKSKIVSYVMGKGSICNHNTNTGSYKYCYDCAKKLKKCQICGEKVIIKKKRKRKINKYDGFFNIDSDI